MQAGAAEPRFTSENVPRWQEWNAAEPPDLAVALAHQVAQTVMDVAGPLFWAVLVTGFVAGALGVRFWP